MFLCFNTHGGSAEGIKAWNEEMRVLSMALYDEFMLYIMGKPKLSPISISRAHINYNITEEEYTAVNIKKLLSIFPIHILQSFAKLTTDVSIFLAKKLIQMVKVVNSGETYAFDIISRVILWHILGKSDKNKEAQWGRELATLEMESYKQELGINENTEDIACIQEIYSSIFKNLYTIYKAEEDGDIRLLFEDDIHKLFINMDIQNAAYCLCSMDGGYDAINASFQSVGMQMLLRVILQKEGRDHYRTTLSFIDAEMEEMYESCPNTVNKGKRIIEFPLQSAFGV